MAALTCADRIDEAVRHADQILVHARERGSALTVATISAFRAGVVVRRGDLAAAQADAQAAIELAPDLLGAEYVVLAVSAAVLAGLDRDETPESLRQLIDRSGIRYDTEFLPSSQLRYASGVLLEHARVLLDGGATIRASGQRAAARESLLEALTLASRCGALSLERRA